MYNWKDTRNYRRFRDENGNVIANIIYVDGEEVAVSDEVYEAYASMDRRERYLEERDNDDKPLSVDALLEEGYARSSACQSGGRPRLAIRQGLLCKQSQKPNISAGTGEVTE